MTLSPSLNNKKEKKRSVRQQILTKQNRIVGKELTFGKILREKEAGINLVNGKNLQLHPLDLPNVGLIRGQLLQLAYKKDKRILGEYKDKTLTEQLTSDLPTI